MITTTTQAERRFERDTGRTAMAKTFGRYGPEVQQPVRGIELKGDEKQRLRQTREMLRSMTPEQVMQIIEWHKNLTVFEALILAKKLGYLIVPNDVHDRILNETKDEQYLRRNYPVWAGTFVMYDAPNKPFGEKIVFTREDNEFQYTITFNVPDQFRGKTNCALVIEHPDFDLKDLGNNNYELKVADEKNIHLIKNVPKQDGWYLTDNKHKIPTGKEASNSNRNARHLIRLDDSSYAGILVRNVDFLGFNRQNVYANFRATNRLVVAMVPLAAASKKE